MTSEGIPTSNLVIPTEEGSYDAQRYPSYLNDSPPDTYLQKNMIVVVVNLYWPDEKLQYYHKPLRSAAQKTRALS